MKNRIMRLLAGCLSLFIFNNSLLVAQEQPVVHLNENMKNLGDTMFVLFPLIFDEDKFADQQNAKMIDYAVNNLAAQFQSSKHQLAKHNPGMLVSAHLMAAHLLKIQQAYNTHNHYVLPSMLKEMVYLCSNCHQQDNQKRKLFKDISRGDFSSNEKGDFQFAEFNYMTRDNETAEKYYKRFIDIEHQNHHNYTKIAEAMKRLLYIFVSDEKKYPEAIQYFQHYVSNEKMPAIVTDDLVIWIQGLKRLSSDQSVMEAKVSKTMIENYINQYISANEKESVSPSFNQDQVFYIKLKGLLFRYLASSRDEGSAWSLYWLSRVDRALNDNFYYALSDIYLKECMNSYSKTPQAKICLKEYESYMEATYKNTKTKQQILEFQREIEFFRKRVLQ